VSSSNLAGVWVFEPFAVEETVNLTHSRNEQSGTWYCSPVGTPTTHYASRLVPLLEPITNTLPSPEPSSSARTRASGAPGAG
jgi:hypothetical protein